MKDHVILPSLVPDSLELCFVIPVPGKAKREGVWYEANPTNEICLECNTGFSSNYAMFPINQ